MALELPPLSLYVHFPWCVRKCPYCDFNSHAVRDEAPVDAYIDALVADLELESARAAGRRIVSVFFGGGTPSLMPAAALARVLDAARSWLALERDCEVTLEANPGAADTARFEGYAAAGVNRLSIGAQSFDDDLLSGIGRIHDGASARDAVRHARRAGIDNFNIDLMYGLSGQTAGQAADDVASALELSPAHVSHYELTLEPNTAFHRNPPRLPEEDVMVEMERRCRTLLSEAGFERYEISAFARPAARARHNLNYWMFGDYLGVGAGAHGKLTDLATGRITRTVKHRHPKAYLGAAGDDGPNAFAAKVRTLEKDEIAFEFMLNAGRLSEGFALAHYERVTGLDAADLRQALAPAAERGLIELDQDRCRPTLRGLEFAHEIQVLVAPQVRAQ